MAQSTDLKQQARTKWPVQESTLGWWTVRTALITDLASVFPCSNWAF